MTLVIGHASGAVTSGSLGLIISIAMGEATRKLFEPKLLEKRWEKASEPRC